MVSRLIKAVLLLVLLGGLARADMENPAFPGGGGGVAPVVVTPNNLCTATGVITDARWVDDLTLTAGTPGTASSLTAAFVPADTGKYLVAWNPASGITSQRVITTTILSVTGPTGVTLNYSGASPLTNLRAVILTDTAAGLNAAINTMFPKFTSGYATLGCTIGVSEPIIINRRPITIDGGNMLGDAISGAASTIIWLGSNAAPVIQHAGTVGGTIENINIMGSDTPAGRPVACIEELNTDLDNGVERFDGVMTAGSNILNSASGKFLPAMANQFLRVQGAGLLHSNLYGKVLAYNSPTQITAMFFDENLCTAAGVPYACCSGVHAGSCTGTAYPAAFSVSGADFYVASAGGLNSNNRIRNVACADISYIGGTTGPGFPGSGNGIPVAKYGILGDPIAVGNNDFMMLEHDYIRGVETGVSPGTDFAVGWNITNSHFNRDGVGIDLTFGNGNAIDVPEDADSGMMIDQGSAHINSINAPTGEIDQYPPIAPSWTPRRGYSRAYVIKDSNANNEQMVFVDRSLTPGSGDTEPTWPTSTGVRCGIAGIARASNIVTVTLGTCTQIIDNVAHTAVVASDFAPGDQVWLGDVVSDQSFDPGINVDSVTRGIQAFVVDSIGAGTVVLKNQIVNGGATTEAISGPDATATCGDCGNIYHAVVDKNDTWVNLGPFAHPIMFMGIDSVGTGGGSVEVSNGGFASGPYTSYVWPVVGDIIAGDNTSYSIVGHNFSIPNNSSTAVGATQIGKVDLSSFYDDTHNFTCDSCKGFVERNFNVTATGCTNNQHTRVHVNNMAGGNGPQVAGIGGAYVTGEAFEANLTCGHATPYAPSPGFHPVDAYRSEDRGGRVVIGGPLNVGKVVNPPAGPSSLICKTAGAQSYYFVEVCVAADGTVSGISPVGQVNNCANTVSTTNWIFGVATPIDGCAAYDIYRTDNPGVNPYGFVARVANDSVPSNSGVVSPPGAIVNSFIDVTGSPGAAPPTSGNTTGNMNVAGHINSITPPADYGDMIALNNAAPGLALANLPTFPLLMLTPNVFSPTLGAAAPGVYLKMNDIGAALQFTDSSGNANHCVCDGGQCSTNGWTLGVAGPVIDDATLAANDAAAAGCTVATAASDCSGDTCSCVMWVKRGAVGAVQYMLSQKNGGFAFLFTSTNNFGLYDIDGAGATHPIGTTGPTGVSNAQITDTTTYHEVGFSKDGATLHLYLDGMSITPVLGSNYTLAPTDATLYVGTFKGASPKLNADVGQVMCAPLELSPNEFSMIYEYGVANKNGAHRYCSDCKDVPNDAATAGAVCLGGGTGTDSYYANGIYRCD